MAVCHGYHPRPNRYRVAWSGYRPPVGSNFLIGTDVQRIVSNHNISGSGAGAPGVRAFQLRILADMRGNDAIVRDALQTLGADHAEMMRNREQTEDIFLPTGRFENAVALLGPPKSARIIGEPSASNADYTPLTKLTYNLPLWPGLDFYLVGTPGAPIPHDFGFARSSDAPPVDFNRFEDLQPWSCVLDEVIEHFGRPVQEVDIWAPFAEYKFATRTVDGSIRQFWATFSWNLLQRAEWV